MTSNYIAIIKTSDFLIVNFFVALVWAVQTVMFFLLVTLYRLLRARLLRSDESLDFGGDGTRAKYLLIVCTYS